MLSKGFAWVFRTEIFDVQHNILCFKSGRDQ